VKNINPAANSSGVVVFIVFLQSRNRAFHRQTEGAVRRLPVQFRAQKPDRFRA